MRTTETEKVNSRSSGSGTGTSGVSRVEERLDNPWLEHPRRRDLLGAGPHRAQSGRGGQGTGRCGAVSSSSSRIRGRRGGRAALECWIGK
jgi:hypothetical protein